MCGQSLLTVHSALLCRRHRLRAYAAADLRRAIEAYKFFYGTVATEAVMQ